MRPPAASATPFRTERRDRAGFSLLELLAALIIIGILTALAAPRIDAEKFYVDGAVQHANTAFMAAQREAVSQQHNVLVVFDTANASLRTVWDVNNSGAEDNAEHVRVTALSERIRFAKPSGVAPKNGLATALSPMRGCGGMPCLIVQRNGSLDREASFYLTSRRSLTGGGRETDTRFLEVNRASGRPQSWKYSPSGWVVSF
jgi:prepilin-type N-terminal cleavage/methylation domain-containing protein